jgi:hypothetical protein
VRVGRPAEHHLGHVLEAHLGHPLRVPAGVVPAHAHGRERLVDVVLDDGQVRALDAAVLGRLQVEVLELEVPARPQVVKRLAEDVLGRLEARGARPPVDVVKRLREEPIVLGVVDLELAVLWHAGSSVSAAERLGRCDGCHNLSILTILAGRPRGRCQSRWLKGTCWLRRRLVDDDFQWGLRLSRTKVDRPNSRAGGYVQHTMRRGPDRGQVKFIIKCYLPHSMLKIYWRSALALTSDCLHRYVRRAVGIQTQSVHFSLIVGQHVFSFFIGMIRAAILFQAFGDARRDGIR